MPPNPLARLGDLLALRRIVQGRQKKTRILGTLTCIDHEQEVIAVGQELWIPVTLLLARRIQARQRAGGASGSGERVNHGPIRSLAVEEKRAIFVP